MTSHRTSSTPPPAAGGLPPKRFQILLALADADRHGVDIVREVGRATEGAVRLWPGALYGALEELSASGLIREVEPPADAQLDGNPRFYRLTPDGRVALTAEIERLERVVRAARSKVASPGSR